MFCENCGNKMDVKQDTCPYCGNYLKKEVPVQQNNDQSMFNNNIRSFNQQMMNMNYAGANQNTNANNHQQHQHSNVFNRPINDNEQIINGNINDVQAQYAKQEQAKSLASGIVLGAFALIIIGIVYMYSFNTNIYLSDDSYQDQEEVKEVQPTTKSKYKTVIVYDNKYKGVSATTEEKANKLIIKDSTEQKKNCSKEIIAIEDEIIEKYGITAVNLCEMDTAFAKEVGNVFKKIYEEYPGTQDVLTNLTLVNASMSQGYIAAFQPIFTFATNDTNSTYPWILKTQIYLNTTYFLNQERLKSSVEDGSASGHFPPNATMYSPVAHEMGHYLSFLAMMKNYNVDSILLIEETETEQLYKLIEDFGNGDFSLKMIKEAYENCKKETGTTLAFDDWRATISSYAVAKDNSGNYIYDETIAEAFHDVYLNGDNAVSASKHVVAVLKSKLNG